MTELIEGISLFPLILTIGAYQIGLWCRKKWNNPLCNPILIAVILVCAVLLLGKLPVESYQTGTAGISWLLTPATICLALPLYQQLKELKSQLPAILAGVIAGTLASLLGIFLLCRLFRLDHAVTVSLLPKSVTTAMGTVLSAENGGLAPLTTTAILVTGIIGSFLGPWLIRLLRLRSPIAQGVAIGTASHVIGTAKATELGAVQGAVSSLSLTVAGILTALLFPLVCSLL
jgi:putative effector of murein hydrolase